MEEFRQLLLDVWRESCRHVEIGEAVGRMRQALFRRLPVDLVIVRRWSCSRSRSKPWPSASAGRARRRPNARSDLPAGDFEQFARSGAAAARSSHVDGRPSRVPPGWRAWFRKG